jgi:hypothetical protein
MFKFAIRELLLLTMIVGLAVGWWLERRDTQRRLEAIREWAGLVATDDYPLELFEDLPAAEYRGVRILKTSP